MAGRNFEPEQGRAVSDPGADTRAELMRQVIRDFRVVVRTIQAHSRWVEKQCGVSAAQLWAMWELATAPGTSVSELAQALSIHQSTVSNLLDKLEKKGLVRRERRGRDQRVVQLSLTASGEALLAKAPAPAQGALSHALGRMSDEALAELDTGLDALLKAMGIADMEAAMRPLSER